MIPSPLSDEALTDATPAQIHSALFHQLVTGHAQIAMLFLGKYPNPQSGHFEPAQPEIAKLYLDQLEMLEVKTKGNLSPEEALLLQQLLTATRLSFAEVMDAQIET
jgi:hypothetical protein